MLLDRTLAMYGPTAKPARDGLRNVVQRALDGIWGHGDIRPENLNSTATRDAVNANFARIENLAATSDTERSLKSLALQEAELTADERLMMFEQLGASIPLPMLVVLIFWLSMLFLGIGLLSRFNATVCTALLVAAISVAAAIFLILELGEPYRGIMRISDEPLRNALAQIDRP